MKLHGIPDSALNRIAQITGQSLELYHVSNELFDSFDTAQTAQGILWFAKDRAELLSSGSGAGLYPGRPVYVYDCRVTVANPAGWDEYEKYGIGELKGLGFDSVDLDDSFVVFDPDDVEILSVYELDAGDMYGGSA